MTDRIQVSAACRMATAVLLLLILSVPGRAQATALQTDPAFTIDPEVTQQDADLVAEGILLAQDFFTEKIGATIDREVHVTVRSGADPQAPGIVAFSMGRSIIVYTGSPGWLQSSPAEKLAAVVHEYTHYYQYLMTGMDILESPAWFEEGIAEYLGLAALDQLQIIDQEDIESWYASQVIILPPDRTLAELESFAAFDAMGASGYPFAYLAVAELVRQTGLSAVQPYYQALASGASFELALQASFGVSPAEHYRRVDDLLKTLTGSANTPDDIAVIEGHALTSPIRLAEAPDQVAAGEQALIRGRTVEASICALTLHTEDGVSPIERTTFADGNGDVFWLVTIPSDVPAGLAELRLDCGGPPLSSEIAIAA